MKALKNKSKKILSLGREPQDQGHKPTHGKPRNRQENVQKNPFPGERTAGLRA